MTTNDAIEVRLRRGLTAFASGSRDQQVEARLIVLGMFDVRHYVAALALPFKIRIHSAFAALRGGSSLRQIDPDHRRYEQSFNGFRSSFVVLGQVGHASSVGRIYERLEPRLTEWILAQPMFFVATAPLAGDGHVNVSPKGLDGSLIVLDPTRLAYLDVTASGAETIAHLRENGRIVLMLCAFDGAPQTVRIHGRGTVHLPGTDGFVTLHARFSDPRDHNVRSIIEIGVERISDSCGFSVPLMSYRGQRDLLTQWAERKTSQELAEYRAKHNMLSIDGRPALS